MCEFFFIFFFYLWLCAQVSCERSLITDDANTANPQWKSSCECRKFAGCQCVCNVMCMVYVFANTCEPEHIYCCMSINLITYLCYRRHYLIALHIPRNKWSYYRRLVCNMFPFGFSNVWNLCFCQFVMWIFTFIDYWLKLPDGKMSFRQFTIIWQK